MKAVLKLGLYCLIIYLYECKTFFCLVVFTFFQSLVRLLFYVIVTYAAPFTYMCCNILLHVLYLCMYVFHHIGYFNCFL